MSSPPDLTPAEAVEMMTCLIALEDDLAARPDHHPLRQAAVEEVRQAVHAGLRMNTDILTGFQDSAKGELIACHEHLQTASDLIAGRMQAPPATSPASFASEGLRFQEGAE